MKFRVPGPASLWVALALCLLTLLTYANGFGTGFALDNRGLILEDTRIRDASPENLANIFQHTDRSTSGAANGTSWECAANSGDCQAGGMTDVMQGTMVIRQR